MPEMVPFTSPVSFADLFVGRMNILTALVMKGDADELLVDHSDMNAAAARALLAGCEGDIDWLRSFYERYADFPIQAQEGETVSKRSDNFIAAIRKQMTQNRGLGLQLQPGTNAPAVSRGNAPQQRSFNL